jgi:hypothetical protein
MAGLKFCVVARNSCIGTPSPCSRCDIWADCHGSYPMLTTWNRLHSWLWAEAAAAEGRGESHRLDASLWEAAAEAQEDRRSEDPWELVGSGTRGTFPRFSRRHVGPGKWIVQAVGREQPLLPKNAAPHRSPAPQGPAAAMLTRPQMIQRMSESGAGEGIRTLDPNLGKVVLYP